MMYYNFVRIHKTLRVTPAMAAGLFNTFSYVAFDWAFGWVEDRHDFVVAAATLFIAWFTIVLARVGRRQIEDTRILQRAYTLSEKKPLVLCFAK